MRGKQFYKLVKFGNGITLYADIFGRLQKQTPFFVAGNCVIKLFNYDRGQIQKVYRIFYEKN